MFVYPLLAVTSLLLFMSIKDRRLWQGMPPGPKPLPFFGNQHQLAKSKPWIQFERWSESFGPIFTIWIGRRPTLVLSDPHIAQELLEKRSTKYSSRPRMVAMGELLWKGASILVQPYSKAWSVRRKLLHQTLMPKALQEYIPIQEAEATRLCCQLVQDSKSWEKQFERFTSSVVFAIAYGHRIDSLKSNVIKQRFDFMKYSASLNVPGKYLVESIPALKHLPNLIAPWKREIEEHGKKEADANLALVNAVRSDIEHAKASGNLATLPKSLCRMLLEIREREADEFALSDRDFSFIPASLFGAGADTTASTLCSAVLAFVTHPDAVYRAQKELDAAVGPDRIPTFADQSKLPYISAVVKEVLRWRPVAVLGGTPHASTEDDTYNGFFIPKGTTVLSNSWAISMNPKYYPNPHVFEPRRFLGLEAGGSAEFQGLSSHPSKSGHSSFGWGRRICPGADLASNSLFIALAKLLWAFNISPMHGVQYDIFNYTDGFNIRPRSFQCNIEVRDEAREHVVTKELRGANDFLERFPAFD
ncbi:cytochrome protein [Truncatella angustata]|uniref:Cytochrome protein n=1 Tax=Truncatella angustata TaxID=152316 RepID=A0A9P8UUA4_9PEZI|nr:cytochrome protein [Truncatella angustata]KAH6658483.1 cytochrome protein [Truncatella angustata]